MNRGGAFWRVGCRSLDLLGLGGRSVPCLGDWVSILFAGGGFAVGVCRTEALHFGWLRVV